MELTAEHRKYVQAYQNPEYRAHGSRLKNMQEDLRSLPAILNASLLDVGCGRGEMLDFASNVGFVYVRGVEVVPYLCDGERVVQALATELPFADKSFDVVLCNDVMEHLHPGEDELVCKELLRVARKHILITANNMPSTMATGEELHINKRPYDEWHRLFGEWFGQSFLHDVTWIKTDHTHSTERWRIDL
jgi:SAM-dependent methyltransferase